MKIDIVKVSETNKPVSFEIPAEDIDLGDENIRLKGPVLVKGRFEQNSAAVEFNGTVEGDSETFCTRCLKAIENPLALEVHTVYTLEDGSAGEQSSEVDQADLDTDVVADGTLDIAEAAREQIILSIPEQLFCSDDCKGLCAKCGADLNLINCKCKESELDPRWAALKDLN